MADDPRALVAERLARSYTAQMAALRDATERGVAAVWDTLGHYNRADIDPFLDRALPVVEAAQTQAAALTDAYVAQQVQIMAGDPVAPAGIVPGDVVGAAVRNGTAPETVYTRSFIQVWSDLANGVQWVDAVAHGGHRARQAARTDVSLAGRKSAQLAMDGKPHVVGYRRVLNGRSCRFCAVASTQRYHKADLMPLHPSCDCGIALLVGQRDPGQVINEKLLSQLQDDAYRRDYWNEHGFVDPEGNPVTDPKKIRAANRDVKVVDHGELGPTLVSDRHHLDKPGTVEGTGKADDGIERLSSRGGGGRGGGDGNQPPPAPPGGEPPEVPDAWRQAVEQDPIRQRSAERYARHRGMSVDEYNDAVDQHLRELAHDARPSIAMPQEDLDQVLLDGRFKSLHETGTSGGATNVPNRERLEENVFGYPAGMPAQDRPIYGYLASPDEARSFVVDHYGRRSDTSVPASVKLKPDILDRSTVTFGDSLDATVAGRDPALMPVPAGDIDHRAASLLSQDPLEWDSLEGVFPYPEVQYHGGVRVEDIDEVVFGDSPAPDVTGRLDALGIPWSVQPGL